MTDCFPLLVWCFSLVVAPVWVGLNDSPHHFLTLAMQSDSLCVIKPNTGTVWEHKQPHRPILGYTTNHTEKIQESGRRRLLCSITKCAQASLTLIFLSTGRLNPVYTNSVRDSFSTLSMDTNCLSFSWYLKMEESKSGFKFWLCLTNDCQNVFLFFVVQMFLWKI